ncbi:MAG: T9SS type A sorting domain-containing protein, partial [Caldisericaceae bacterium]|nr:T9SS type A sorting domain-containing protein [Caldisericaceae bacterium]
LMSQNSDNRILKKIYITGININFNIKKQLKTVDINHDPLPDLLLFDDTQLLLLINSSQVTDINFYVGEGTFNNENIKDVIPYNEDNNSETDLLILNNDISVIKNITENLIDPTNHTVLFSNVPNVSKVQIGDIDGDLVSDLVFLDNGAILSRLGDPQFGLTGSYSLDTLAISDYSDFTLADLDNNPPLEIVCLGSQNVEAISYLQQYFDETNFIRTLFYFNNINQFETFMAIDDFGGDPFYDYNKVLDIGFLKSDSLFIFQNATVNPNELIFSEIPVFQTELFQSFDQFFTVDYEADGLPEIALVDRFAGRLNFWQKSMSWMPMITVDSVQKSRVQLSWTSFPEEFGTLNFYELEKSRDPYFEDRVEIIDVNDTIFIDHDVWSFEDYWYRVRAVYNDGQFSEISDPVRVQIYREISGNVTGVLADTTLPYMVIGDLFVPRVDSLIILNGVQLAFRENTGMEVYGTLSIRGNNDEEMVNFFERDSIWRGIRLYQNPDTAYFEWFSIHGAKIGLLANERPIKIHLGGIVGCETAMQVEQLDFWMENILIDSVFGGIQSGGMVNGFIKNIDILHAKDFSVLASGVSTDLRIKNAIIWHNLGPVTAADSAKIFIDYSTVDNIGTRVFAQHISKLPPLFLENLENEQFQLDPMSPTIDAGDPNDPFDLEPQPNGGRINQGTLGNTPLATPSLQPRIDAKLIKKDLKAFATGLDSTTLFIKNRGFVELNVDSLVFKKARFDSIFNLEMQDNFTVAPQDSIPLKLWFKPPHRGTFLDSLVIVCNDPHLLFGRYVLAVRGTGLNSKPVLLNEPLTVAFVDSLYRFKPQFFDLDGDSVLTQSVLLPDWLKLTSNGELTGTPALSDTGKHLVRLLFDDQHGGIDSLKYVIQVLDLTHPVSIIPVIKAFPLGGPLSKQSAINIIVTVFDSTQNKLTDASKTYHFSGQLFKEGQPEPLEQIDTSGIRNFAFYPLLDGDYKFILTASKILVAGQQVEAKTEIPFRIKASQKSFARFRWHMISYPRQQELNWAAFEYADSAAVLYRWDANEKKYFPITRDETIEPGWAFWLMPLRNITFDLNTLHIATAEQQTSLKINLKKGWNQIGLPWPYYKRWINMRFAQGNSASQLNINQAISDSLIQPAAFWFEQSDEFIGYHVELFDSTTYAKPWVGYWLYANTEVSVFVDNTPEFPFELTGITSSTAKLAKIANNHNDWLLNFSLQSEKLKDDFTMVGLSNLPSKPILEPPVFNEFTSLAVTEGEQSYCRLLKPWFDDNKTYAYWDLTVTTSAIEKEHRLSWQQLAGQNKDLFAYLVDLDHETMIKLWEKNDYVFTPETNIYHFRLYVSNDQNFKPSIIPLQYSLAQNFPNPFNPTTTIKIGVPETGSKDRISVRVYDVLGKEIRVLFDGHLPAGFHKFEWDGTNATGEAVASGIYFYQLRAGQVSIMKKMVLLR